MQQQLPRPDFGSTQLRRTLAKVASEARDGADVGGNGARRKVAQLQVVGHALAQRARLRRRRGSVDALAPADDRPGKHLDKEERQGTNQNLKRQVGAGPPLQLQPGLHLSGRQRVGTDPVVARERDHSVDIGLDGAGRKVALFERVEHLLAKRLHVLSPK